MDLFSRRRNNCWFIDTRVSDHSNLFIIIRDEYQSPLLFNDRTFNMLVVSVQRYYFWFEQKWAPQTAIADAIIGIAVCLL